MTSIKINMRAMPAPRARITKNGAYNPSKYTNYKKALQMHFKGFKRYEALRGLEIEVSCFLIPPRSIKHRKYPFPNFDVDNALKGILDAGNKILWDDDLQIVKATVSKAYAEIDTIFITIKEV